MAWAEVLGASDLFIGVNSLDYSGYPDCRPEYIESFERMANLATRAAVSGNRLLVHSPLIRMAKREIIELGGSLGVDYSSVSCYEPDGRRRPLRYCDAFSFASGLAERVWDTPSATARCLGTGSRDFLHAPG